MKYNLLSFLTIMILLAGCSGLLTSKQHVDKFYTVNAVDYEPAIKVAAHPSIMIEAPSLSKGLDSTKIMLMHSPQRLDYFATARWSAALGKMVQSSLIESFENSEALARVGGDYDSLRPDYILLLEVHDFQAEYHNMQEAPIIHIKLVAKLAKHPQRDLVATFTAETLQQAEKNNLTDIMYTFDQAYAGAQKLLIDEMVDYFS